MRFVKNLAANSFVEKDTLILIYNAIVRRYYCCEVWSLFCEDQSRLKKLQNTAARVTLSVSNVVEYTIALRAFGKAAQYSVY